MYQKNIENGYIISVAICSQNGNISDKEYSAILDAIHNRPTAPDGYGYRLREDLTWEQYELPIAEESEEELTDQEAYNIIMGVSE